MASPGGSWLGEAETERLLEICNCHRLRRPYLFRLAGKDRGEKGAWMRLVLSASEFRRVPMFRSGVPLGDHPTYVLVRAA